MTTLGDLKVPRSSTYDLYKCHHTIQHYLTAILYVYHRYHCRGIPLYVVMKITYPPDNLPGCNV